MKASFGFDWILGPSSDQTTGFQDCKSKQPERSKATTHTSHKKTTHAAEATQTKNQFNSTMALQELPDAGALKEYLNGNKNVVMTFSAHW